MRKILFILFITIHAVAHGQNPYSLSTLGNTVGNSINVVSGGIKAGKTLQPPMSLNTWVTPKYNLGNMYFDSAGTWRMRYNDGSHNLIFADTRYVDSLFATAVSGVTLVQLNDSLVRVYDTTAALRAAITAISGSGVTLVQLTDSVQTRVRYTDTAAMLSPYERTAHAAATYQPILGFTPENVANKATDFTTLNNTKYPTTSAVNTFLNTALGSYYTKVAADARFAPISIDGTVKSVTAGAGLSGGVITTTGTISMPNTGTANTYAYPSSVTTDAQGRLTSVTAGSTPTTGTVTSIGLTAGTGISIGGASPITGSGSFSVTNTAPDQTVVLTNGTGINVTGIYPNFTITNTSTSSGGTVTNVIGGTNISITGTSTIQPTVNISGTIAVANGGTGTTSQTSVNTTPITLGSNNTITAAAGTLTGTTLNSTVVNSSLTGVGTLVSGSIPYSLLTGTPTIQTTINGTTIANNTSNTITASANTLTTTTLNPTVINSSLQTLGTLTAGSIPYSLITGTPTGLPPTGAAGGDLQGTYPNPTLLRQLTPTAVKTTTYSAAINDFIPCDNTSGSFTITLPTAPADKSIIGVKLVVLSGTNTISVTCGGSDVFNKTAGSTTLTLTVSNQAMIIQYKASTGIWYVISTDVPTSAMILSGATAGGSLGGTYPNPTVVTNANLTGNVTSVGNATTIAAGVVTNAMLAGSIDLTSKVTGALPPANGGTGIANNAAMTVTGSGNFGYTRTLTAATNSTFPAGTQTLAATTLAQSFTAGQAGTPVTLTDAATIAIDLATSNNFRVVLGGNRTMGVPTNIAAGQTGYINIWQDITGTRTLTLPFPYTYQAATAPTLSTGKAVMDFLVYKVDYYATSSSITATNATPGVFTWTAHGLITGQQIQFSAGTTTTPALNTTYWVNVTGANTFNISSSFANLQALTYVTTSGTSGSLTATACGISTALNTDFRR